MLRQWNLKRYLIHSPFYMQNFIFSSPSLPIFPWSPIFVSLPYLTHPSHLISLQSLASSPFPSKQRRHENEQHRFYCLFFTFSFLEQHRPGMELCRRLQDEEQHNKLPNDLYQSDPPSSSLDTIFDNLFQKLNPYKCTCI